MSLGVVTVGFLAVAVLLAVGVLAVVALPGLREGHGSSRAERRHRSRTDRQD